MRMECFGLLISIFGFRKALMATHIHLSSVFNEGGVQIMTSAIRKRQGRSQRAVVLGTGKPAHASVMATNRD
jgi:hypothetical protein